MQLKLECYHKTTEAQHWLHLLPGGAFGVPTAPSICSSKASCWGEELELFATEPGSLFLGHVVCLKKRQLLYHDAAQKLEPRAATPRQVVPSDAGAVLDAESRYAVAGAHRMY